MNNAVFYAGECYRYSEKTLIGKVTPSCLNPWKYYSIVFPEQLPFNLTRSEIQSHAFWGRIVDEIENSTSNVLFHGKQRKKTKNLISLLIQQPLLENFDDKIGDVAAMICYFKTTSKCKWEMRQVALALIVIYMNAWEKLSIRNVSLESYEIDAVLLVDKIVLSFKKQQKTINSEIIAGIVWAVIALVAPNQVLSSSTCTNDDADINEVEENINCNEIIDTDADCIS